jgi:hypothetical protein
MIWNPQKPGLLEECRLLRERVSLEEMARAKSETLLQQTGRRLERLQTAASIACKAWEHTPNYSVHEIRCVMRELRSIVGEPSSKGDAPSLVEQIEAIVTGATEHESRVQAAIDRGETEPPALLYANAVGFRRIRDLLRAALEAGGR